jgi:hypothetical protein
MVNNAIDLHIRVQLKIYRYGEQLVDRMDFEELALKSIDPSLGPTPDFGGHDYKRTEESEPRQVVSLVLVPFCLAPFNLGPRYHSFTLNVSPLFLRRTIPLLFIHAFHIYNRSSRTERRVTGKGFTRG